MSEAINNINPSTRFDKTVRDMPDAPDAANDVCGCGSCTPDLQHLSGCAVHNEPAYPKGECTCAEIRRFAFFAEYDKTDLDRAEDEIRALEEKNRALVEIAKLMRRALQKVISLDWSKRQDAVEYLLMMDKECQQAIAAYDRLEISP